MSAIPITSQQMTLEEYLEFDYTKHNEKFWFQSEYVGSETLKLESLSCELSVDEIYQGIINES